MAITSVGGPGNGLQQYEEIFTTSSTWNKPNGVKSVEVTVVGGSAGVASGTVSGAGGYIKTLLDVSKVTSCPVIVGSAGAVGPTAGGNSSFGVTDGSATTGYAIAYGSAISSLSNAGARVGVSSLAADTDISQGFYTSPWFSTVSYATTTSTLSASTTWAKINLVNSRYFATGSGSTFSTSTNGTTWTSATLATVSSTANRISYGNGYYVYCIGNTSTTTGTNDSLYYSTDGLTWTAKTVTLGGFNLSVAYGPAGWVASGPQLSVLSKPATANNPSTTWSSYTPTSGWSSIQSNYIVGTSTRYYAFTNSGSVSWKHSTDAQTWTAGTTLPTSVATSDSMKVAVINDTVYYIDTAGALYKIVGTTASLVNSSAVWAKIFDNGTVITANGSAFYDITNGTVNTATGVAQATTKWAGQNFYWTIPASASTTITINTISSATVNSFTDVLGVTSTNNYTAVTPTSSSAVASAGAGGQGMVFPSTSSPLSSMGLGIDDWCWGAALNSTSSTLYYNSRATYGSGVGGYLNSINAGTSAGNQGVVRVRWWQ